MARTQVYRSAAIIAARACGEDVVMDVVANRLAGEVAALASSHNVTGEYLAGIGVEETPGKRGVTDRLVYVDHEAAASIEFGHMQVSRGERGFHTFGHVPGLHILGRVAGRA